MQPRVESDGEGIVRLSDRASPLTSYVFTADPSPGHSVSLCHNLLIPAQNETAVRSLLRSVLSVPFRATGTDDFGKHPFLQPFNLS